MPGRVRQSDIEELKAKADIVDVVGSYISLKPASTGSFKGLCPFHGEKTPSFNVRSNPAFYHCFGCGAGGDVYKFVQEIESLSFMDAVEKLAQKFNYPLQYEDGGEENSSRSRLLALNQLAAEFYQTQLGLDEGSTARDFLVARGFDAESARSFGIGYAPKGWQNLINHATKNGYDLKELVAAGLAMESDKGGYDRFRGRVLWPIRDANSQVLGFGARKLYEDDQGPKYLNTPETPVYHKSSVLYGLDLARKDISKSREVIVVEGYTDVMACHLAGHQTAVATCGTAFGEEHIKLINRLLGQSEDPASVIFTFDPDAAGQKAALKVYGDSNKFNALTFVAAGPDGLDPADLRQQRGDAAISQMLEGKKPLFEFVIRHRISQFSLGDLDSRVAAARSASSVVAQIADPALRTGYTKQLADWVSLDAADVARLVAGDSKAQVNSRVEPMRQSGEAKQVPNSPQARLERQILEVLLQRPESFSFDQLQRMAAAGFSSAEYQKLLDLAVSNGSRLLESGFANLLATLCDEPQLSLIRELSLAPLPATGEAELERYAKGVVKGAMVQALNQEKIDLMAALRRIDPTDNPDAQAAIAKQLVELESERRALMKS
jgi:DNA primase